MSELDVRILDKKCRFQGFFTIEEYQVSHKLFNGGMSKVLNREIFERGDAVAVIPYDPVRNSLIVVEQFRVGAIRTQTNPWLIEFIAGMFSDNESPVDVAVREAKEEANIVLEPDKMRHIMTYLSSPGGTSEQLHLYAAPVDARNVGGVFGLEEEGEDIKVHEIGLNDALALINDGTINNAMTIIGIQWLALNYSQLQSHWADNDKTKS
ncbi:NUDIX domain-containing protein [Thalassotalea sp. M1531]|uniref:ADP-ribose pyrophosphatase n=2 Tax=Thalassotalea algicola TaxID=2716224 RepID=A0A7Y0LDQ0_9GAMM|nr:NUDIX domain-containing protein [Thalassotalea algicola]